MNIFIGIKLLAAYFLDLLIGDPKWLPHPVIGIGKGISVLDKSIQKWNQHLVKKGASAKVTGRLLGLLFPLLIVCGVFLLTYEVLQLLAMIHPWLAIAIEILLISTTIATKGLSQAGMKIYQALVKNNLAEARFELSMVVGRDTEKLNSRDISRGAIETVAENIVDAVTAPLFFAFIGGAPLAMAYRAVNTLDSMVGYKNETYQHIGWASARLDDICNFIPARVTFLFLVMASWVQKSDWKAAWRIGLRDALKHPSPNSGWTEASVAGALKIQLGGRNTYKGVVSNRAKMGDPLEIIQPTHIKKTIDLLYTSTLCYLTIALCISWVLLY
ncbi:adenosylcobinamide-phosphate synthase CbiB [Brevibacillus daliensis]|uniref:adenosylcobinamide-phosphate synthase CbiB n=1 Tax=Brevibacillus daliensis TaxID=2892995 RepID=UPI001E5E202F|nr:adenosylcobinamide-phosphate synthase CbiB [Brevibacillus daliensis]